MSTKTKPAKQICIRCGATYRPMWLVELKQWNRCCATCSVRNLMDALGLPTPPNLLDAHTKKPTLTQDEYYRAIAPKKRKRKA